MKVTDNQRVTGDVIYNYCDVSPSITPQSKGALLQSFGLKYIHFDINIQTRFSIRNIFTFLIQVKMVSKELDLV